MLILVNSILLIVMGTLSTNVHREHIFFRNVFQSFFFKSKQLNEYCKMVSIKRVVLEHQKNAKLILIYQGNLLWL